MDTEAVLRDLLAQTERPLALAEAELRSAQEKIEKLKAERFGLELALARHRGEPAPTKVDSTSEPSRKTEAESPWLRMGRVGAAERALQEAGRPVHRKALQAMLIDKGRDDSLDLLSAALAYLKRNGRAMSKGQGMWVHPDHDDVEPQGEEALDGEDPAEAGSSNLSLLVSERRTEDAGDSGDPRCHPAPVMEA
jgi:hypothetical protein